MSGGVQPVPFGSERSSLSSLAKTMDVVAVHTSGQQGQTFFTGFVGEE